MLTTLQSAYLALGVAANLLSLAHRARTGRFLTPVHPAHGLLTMAAYAACMALDHLGVALARAGFAVLLLAIVLGGVYRHLRPAPTATYASPVSRWVALFINAYGALVTAATLTL